MDRYAIKLETPHGTACITYERRSVYISIVSIRNTSGEDIYGLFSSEELQQIKAKINEQAI